MIVIDCLVHYIHVLRYQELMFNDVTGKKNEIDIQVFV